MESRLGSYPLIGSGPYLLAKKGGRIQVGCRGRVIYHGSKSGKQPRLYFCKVAPTSVRSNLAELLSPRLTQTPDLAEAGKTSRVWSHVQSVNRSTLLATGLVRCLLCNNVIYHFHHSEQWCIVGDTSSLSTPQVGCLNLDAPACIRSFLGCCLGNSRKLYRYLLSYL